MYSKKTLPASAQSEVIRVPENYGGALFSVGVPGTTVGVPGTAPTVQKNRSVPSPSPARTYTSMRAGMPSVEKQMTEKVTPFMTHRPYPEANQPSATEKEVCEEKKAEDEIEGEKEEAIHPFEAKGETVPVTQKASAKETAPLPNIGREELLLLMLALLLLNEKEGDSILGYLLLGLLLIG